MPDVDLITIGSGELTASVNPFGAELWSLVDKAGREYMTDADPAFWTGHAPLLFPIVGALADDSYRHGGAVFSLPKHGFARHLAFEVIEAGVDRVSFRLRDSEATRESYPFAFELDMTFRLEGLTLFMEARIRNPGEEVLPFCFGYHPAFAWPLPGNDSRNGHTITFASEEPGPVRRIDDAGLLLPERFASPVEGRSFTLDPALFEDDALIWDAPSSRGLNYASPSGTTLSIAFPDTPMLGIWQKPGARYICIEPWQGHADAAGFKGMFEEKPGLVQLAPGGVRSLRMDVTIHPAA